MKKFVSIFCTALMLALCAPVFAVEDSQKIPDYEPWKYMMTASMGSCGQCDPSYTFQYNFYLREEERKASVRIYKPGGEDNILKDMSVSDLLFIGALTAAGTFIVFSILFRTTGVYKDKFLASVGHW